MDQQNLSSNLSVDSCEFDNLNTSQSVLQHNDVNSNVSDPGEFLQLPSMLNHQRLTVMDFEMSGYEKALSENDYAINSMHTNMTKNQNNNYVPTDQCMNFREKTKPISGTCLHQITGFTNICDHLNKLGDTVDNARTMQNYVMNLVDQTTKTFQEQFLNIDETLKQVNFEKIRAKQELETLERKYSLDMIAYKSNFEEYTKEIDNLRTENYWLLKKLNETNIRLNDEKEMVSRLKQNYEKVLNEMESQNVLLINQNKSLKDEINTLKISLDENKKQLDIKLAAIKEQTELFDNLKSTEKLNDELNKENVSLKEHNDYLEKKFSSVMEDFSKFKLSHKEIQDEKESKFKDMCKKYDDLLKMQEEMLVEKTEKLQLQNENKYKIQVEEIDLKRVVDECNDTILNLQEELKNNYHFLIPELQNKIVDLTTNLTNAYQILQELDQENLTEFHKLKKEKNELENQTEEHIKQIEKLTTNNIKYKSKAKQLYVEIIKLRLQLSEINQKIISQNPPVIETIEISSDENDDCSIVEFNNKDVTNLDANVQSTSNKVNKKRNYSSLKKNSSPIRQINNSKVKKHRISINNIPSQVSYAPNQEHPQKFISGGEEGQTNVNEKINCDNDITQSKTPLKEKHNGNYESKNQVLKKIFKKPADIKLYKNKSKPKNIQNIDLSELNSPVNT